MESREECNNWFPLKPRQKIEKKSGKLTMVEEINKDCNMDFCLKLANEVLLKKILEESSSNNVLSSPLSFHVILSLMAAGSLGHTLEQLLSFLGSHSIENINLFSSQLIDLAGGGGSLEAGDGGPTLSFINSVWVDQGLDLKPAYEQIVRDVYKAQVEKVDLFNQPDKAIEDVNSWAENATRGLIKKIIPPNSIHDETALILANALYFKADWDKKFYSSMTQTRSFHLLNGQIVHVPFMTKLYESHLYNSFDGYSVLKLPYQRNDNGHGNKQFSMYFILPHKKDGLPNLVKKFNSNPSFFGQDFDLSRMELPELFIPKFQFSFEFEASEFMKKLGLELPFSLKAEFGKMIDFPEINVEKIFHKACIEVNEEGTEAAAITAAVLVPQRGRLTPNFVADHPFLFMIREESTGVVFFIGAVLNPLLDS